MVQSPIIDFKERLGRPKKGGKGGPLCDIGASLTFACAHSYRGGPAGGGRLRSGPQVHSGGAPCSRTGAHYALRSSLRRVMKDDVAGSGVSRVRFSHVSPCHRMNTGVVSKQIAGGVVVVAASETKAVVFKKPRQVHEKGITWDAEVTLGI